MLVSQNLIVGRRKYLFALMLIPFIALICVAFTMTDDEDFDMARREVLLRKVGHELLLQSGDSTSRVLPVKKIAENEYQITFENNISFQPDSLVNAIRTVLAKDALAHDYVVNVLNCSDASVAYGYAFSDNKKNDIVTCMGRKQPVACYIIDVKFKPTSLNTIATGYVLGGLPFLAFVGFLFIRSAKPRVNKRETRDADSTSLGSVLFDVKHRKLIIGRNTIELTGTETRVLSIFAQSPNETIERSRLQKEIWEDEGVIVGRSLDMFISKLRKKLEQAPDLKITVIRGKGYKLEIGV